MKLLLILSIRKGFALPVIFIKESRSSFLPLQHTMTPCGMILKLQLKSSCQPFSEGLPCFSCWCHPWKRFTICAQVYAALGLTGSVFTRGIIVCALVGKRLHVTDIWRTDILHQFFIHRSRKISRQFRVWVTFELFAWCSVPICGFQSENY